MTPLESAWVSVTQLERETGLEPATLSLGSIARYRALCALGTLLRPPKRNAHNAQADRQPERQPDEAIARVSVLPGPLPANSIAPQNRLARSGDVVLLGALTGCGQAPQAAHECSEAGFRSKRSAARVPISDR